jgi:hypothetical protein
MPFVLAERRPRFKWTVSVMRPDAKTPGKHVASTFTAEFDPLTPEEEQEKKDRAMAVLDEGEAEVAEPDALDRNKAELRRLMERLRGEPEEEKAHLRRVFVGWGQDLVDQDNKPIPYSDEVREQLLGFPEIRRALMTAYQAAMNPENPKGARRGN